MMAAAQSGDVARILAVVSANDGAERFGDGFRSGGILLCRHRIFGCNLPDPELCVPDSGCCTQVLVEIDEDSAPNSTAVSAKPFLYDKRKKKIVYDGRTVFHGWTVGNLI
jgi:hypothetical protein